MPHVETTDGGMNLRSYAIRWPFFLVIQRASEPLSVLFHFRVIRFARAHARIRSSDDLCDRSDPPTARSDAPTCGCTREYDKSRRIWARSAHRVPFETGRTSRANVCSFSRTSRLPCVQSWSMIPQWQSPLVVNRCDVARQSRNEESAWWARSTWPRDVGHRLIVTSPILTRLVTLPIRSRRLTWRYREKGDARNNDDNNNDRWITL